MTVHNALAPTEPPGSLAAAAIEVGTIGEIPLNACFNETRDVDHRIHGGVIVPCDGSHQLEMFAHETLPDALNAPYPREDAMIEAGETTCRPLFEGYVGIDYDTSEYTFWYYTPDSSTWAYARRVDCAIGNNDRSTMTGGSARNARR